MGWIVRFVGIMAIVLAAATGVVAQHSLDISGGVGVSVPNALSFPDLRQPVYDVSAGWTRYTFQSRAFWHQLYGAPLVSVRVSRQTLGNDGVLGSAYAIMPALYFPVHRYKRTFLRWGAGLGVAYLTRANSDELPQNTAIGNEFNFSAQVALDAEYILNPSALLYTRFGVSHYSSGGLSKPNFGINIPLVALGMRIPFSPVCRTCTDTLQRLDVLPRTHWAPVVATTLGFKWAVNDGPLYNVWGLSVGIRRNFGYTYRVSAGIERQHDMQASANINYFNLENQNPTRWKVWVSNEWLLGPYIGFVAGAGVYIQSFYARQSPFAMRLGIQAYPRGQWRQAMSPYIGGYIHTALGSAEFAELCVGMAF
jgi:hypothetical protein